MSIAFFNRLVAPFPLRLVQIASVIALTSIGASLALGATLDEIKKRGYERPF